MRGVSVWTCPHGAILKSPAISRKEFSVRARALQMGTNKKRREVLWLYNNKWSASSSTTTHSSSSCPSIQKGTLLWPTLPRSHTGLLLMPLPPATQHTTCSYQNIANNFRISVIPLQHSTFLNQWCRGFLRHNTSLILHQSCHCKSLSYVSHPVTTLHFLTPVLPLLPVTPEKT